MNTDPTPAPSEAQTLEPCPFCGNTQPELVEPHKNHWRVGCSKCGSYNNISLGSAGAIRQWNSRTELTALTTAAEALRTERDEARRDALNCRQIISCYVDEAEAYEKQAAELRADAHSYKSKFNDLRADRDAWQRRAVENEQGMAALEAKLKEAEERNKALEVERSKYVSDDEARELQDVLRTLAPSGRALLTSARELVTSWEGFRKELPELRADRDALAQRVSELEADKEALQGSGCYKLDTAERVRFYEQDFYILSNFSSFAVNVFGRDFATSEHAYHWRKFNETDTVCANAIRHARSAHDAFKLAEQNKDFRRKDWDAVKIEVMREILWAKVTQHEYVKRKLLATGTRELVEDSWRDDFWGWGANRDGKNMLGNLWMEIRDALTARTAAQPPKP